MGSALGRHISGWIVASVLGASCATPVSSEPLDSVPLRPGAEVILADKASVETKGASGSEIKLPRSGRFIFDYAIEDGKELMFTLITDGQYQQILKSKKPSGSPLMKVIVRGEGSQSVTLKAGNYFLGINNYADTDTAIMFRASFLRK